MIFITRFMVLFLHDGFLWIQWWSRLMFLLLLYYAGLFFFSPLYFNFLFIFDVEFMTVGQIRGQRPAIHALDYRNYVFSEVINISGDSLAYLRRSVWNFSRAYANKVLTFWQLNRDKLGIFPPHGWPMKLTMGLFLIAIYTSFIMIGYLKIIMRVLSKWYNLLKDSLIKLRSLRSAKVKIKKDEAVFRCKQNSDCTSNR